MLPADVDKARKIDLLRHADDVARSQGPSVTQVQVALGDSSRHFVVANSEGVYASDHQIRTRFNISCVATGDTGMQTGYRPIAGTRGFELLSEGAVEEAARGAAQQAITKLDARPAPSGDFPVVLAGVRGNLVPRGVRPRTRGGRDLEARVGLYGKSRTAGGELASYLGR